MKLRLSLLVLSIAIALGAVVGDSIAERRVATQNAMLYAVGTPQAVGNTDASAGRISNKSENSKGGVTTMPNVVKAGVEAPAVTRFRINAGQSHFNSTQASTAKTGGEQYQSKITGRLTLHGVTRPITIPAQAPLSGGTIRVRGGSRSGIAITTSNACLREGGTVKAKDEMKLSFDVVANKY
jgi:YceI-like protein